MQIGRTVARIWENLRTNLGSADSPAIVELESQESKDWAVLVYLEGQDGLAYSSRQALQQMQASTGSSLHVAVHHDHQPTWKEKLLPGMGPAFQRRYHVQSEQLSTVGEGGQSLGEFLGWGMKNFPAKHYAVVVKRHGLGFLDAKQLRKELEAAEKESGKKPDLLALDSCLMQQAEVAYELRERAQVMVGSPSNVPAAAFPYGRVLSWLNQNSGQLDTENLGRLVVEGHRLAGGSTIESAARLDQMQNLAASVKALSHTVMAEKVPPQLVYTAMMSVPPLEGQKVAHIGFDYRDLSSFVQNLASHPQLQNEVVQKACFEVFEKVEQSLLRHHVSGPHQQWNNARGFTSYMPWCEDEERQAHYSQLDYARDSDWEKLLGYAQQGQPTSARETNPPAEGNILAKSALYAYKKYISPYLGKACTMTPRCSAYARQAIETHGLWEGIKFSTVRLCSCNGSFCGCHPVPGAKASQVLAADRPLSSSVPQAIPSWKRTLVGGAARLANLAGKVAGAALGTAMAGPAGLAVGLTLGYQAGAGRLDSFNEKLFQRYQPPSQEALMEVEAPLVKLPIALQESWAGSWAEPLSPLAGALTGAAAGLLGGLGVGASWGQKFGGLLAENATRDAFGQLPPNPHVEQSLAGEHAL